MNEKTLESIILLVNNSFIELTSNELVECMEDEKESLANKLLYINGADDLRIKVINKISNIIMEVNE